MAVSVVQHYPVRRGALARHAIVGATLVTAAVVLSACTSGSGGKTGGSSSGDSSSVAGSASSTPSTSASSTSSAPVLPVALTATPAASAQDVNPTTPVTVTATNGTIADVRLTNPAGKSVSGQLSADKKTWRTTEVLGYGKKYTMHATATDASGERSTALNRSFTTLQPDNYTMPYINTIFGNSLKNGATYGVGMVVDVHFDESIANKKAAEKALQVTTSPHVTGAWTWLSDTDAHWRPEQYYAPGTKVTVAANVYGVKVGPGLYGQDDKKVSFVIGAKHISVADASTHHVKVYFSGKLVRNMPTSMGQGGTTTGKNGQTIYLWTMPGTYTVMNYENPAIMSSDSYGLPTNSPLGYAPEAVPWATRISTDGIYLHELDTTVQQQGHVNVSHGCLNLNEKNAKWFFQTSHIGDIVKVVHSGGPGIQLWQGGDWSVPWSKWLAGSALS